MQHTFPLSFVRQLEVVFGKDTSIQNTMHEYEVDG